MSKMNIATEFQGTYITTSKGVEKYESMVARNCCRGYIVQHYTETEQLNVLMSGDKTAIDAMRIFIQKCRDWSNQELPLLDDLMKIKP